MIKHAFTSLVSDSVATDVVQPSDWNAAHIIEVVSADPVSPAVGEFWVLGTGTSPDRLLEFKFCDTDGSVVVFSTVAR